MGRHRMIQMRENGIQLVVEIAEDGDVWLRHLSSVKYDPTRIEPVDDVKYRLTEVQLTGENQDDHHGSKHTGTLPGRRLRYGSHTEERNAFGRRLDISMKDAVTGLYVTAHLQFYDGIRVVRSWTTAENRGERPLSLEYLSSFCLTGLSKEGDEDWEKKSRLSIPYNSWYGELQWREYRLPELGLGHTNWASTQRIVKSVTGTWPTGETMPMGWYENTEEGIGWFWQIESNGSWTWEIGDLAKTLYLQLSGPSFQENQWRKLLAPGESFDTVYAAVAIASAGELPAMQDGIREMTRYRRAIRRKTEADAGLPVIFNDAVSYDLDPDMKKMRPYIREAAHLGCEYFCIDAGWYADGEWWNDVGEWLPSRRRFPGGIEEAMQAIREQGMQPGLWLEPEVIGMNCPLLGENRKVPGNASTGAPLPGNMTGKEVQAPEEERTRPAAFTIPDSWFFQRFGEKVMDHGRYQLDFRNPAVRNYLNEVAERCIGQYGAKYMKLDYNINAGPGTELHSDSLGDGLLGHCRGYLEWISRVMDQYPDVILENCASGGQRMDYASMSLFSLESVTDQGDSWEMARIACASPTAMPPEQCGIWSLPSVDSTEEQVIFSMVNTLLLRIHQTGPITGLNEADSARIREAIACYKTYRHKIPQMLPFWPLGLPKREDGWLCLGLSEEDGDRLLAVWRLNGAPDCLLPLPLSDRSRIEVVYPRQASGWVRAAEQGVLVHLEEPGTARILRIFGK